LRGFPQFHNLHHNNKAQRRSQTLDFKSLFVEIVVVDGSPLPGRKQFLAVDEPRPTLALSTNFHMLLPFVRLSPSAKTG
jgi:hypothetical protein